MPCRTFLPPLGMVIVSERPLVLSGPSYTSPLTGSCHRCHPHQGQQQMQGEAQGSLVVRRGGIIYLVNLVNPNKAGSKAGRGSRGEERGQVRAPRRRNDGRSRRAGANGFSTPLEGIGALATAEIPTAGVFALVNSGLMGVLWSLRGCRPEGKPLASLYLLQPERAQLLLISGAVAAPSCPPR